jgi:hypothetical protein
MDLRRHFVVLVALTGVVATGGSAAAAPHAFRGTITIKAHMLAPGRQLLAGESSDGKIDFTGQYHVHGTLGRRKSYLLTGSGHEQVSAQKHDTAVNGCDQKDFTLAANASGTVHLKRGALGPGDTSPISLSLLPHGHYKVDLTSLQGETDGVALDYRMTYKENDSCPGEEFNRVVNYANGLTTSSDGTRSGIAQHESLWGMGVWHSFGHPQRPDLCHERLVAHETGSLLCGRLRHGRARDSVAIPPIRSGAEWKVDDPPFFPWGPGGLPDPSEDSISDMPTLDTGWVEVLVVNYSLRPGS